MSMNTKPQTQPSPTPAEPYDPIDWGAQMHAAAQAHLDAVAQAEEALDDAVNNESPDIAAIADASPAYGPYCGCTTCVVRETLAAAWPTIVTLVAARGGDTTGLNMKPW